MTYALLMALSLAISGQVEGPKDEFAKEQQKKWNEFYKAEAASFSIALDGDREKLLTLRPEPVLLWSNPVREGETNGSVFVWTYKGRAEVVGTVFSYLLRQDPSKRVIKHSFHTLSRAPLSAERREAAAWSFKAAGIEPRPIPDAPVPSKTVPLRLGQMRDLARQFSATTILGDVEQDLRLLPQPLYRYEGESPGVLDGALFTFVTGTDPELMLVIEARETKAGPRWHFGAGRFTDLALTLRHQRAVLWTYQRGIPVEGGKETYLSLHAEQRDRVIP